ncbi:hypothetical protein OFO10_07330 [Campylobacter sp. VBCF_06 NA8]|nr:hypothetical protein [Campylobacter sp. VBCF_06 NA8]MDA3046968.1 hypothetical protein [Campylobacter sp. VBCF_06 NA8]
MAKRLADILAPRFKSEILSLSKPLLAPLATSGAFPTLSIVAQEPLHYLR